MTTLSSTHRFTRESIFGEQITFRADIYQDLRVSVTFMQGGHLREFRITRLTRSGFVCTAVPMAQHLYERNEFETDEAGQKVTVAGTLDDKGHYVEAPLDREEMTERFVEDVVDYIGRIYDRYPLRMLDYATRFKNTRYESSYKWIVCQVACECILDSEFYYQADDLVMV